METLMQEDWILEKIFRHLPTKAIASTALLVCKKWRDFGLYANHRHLPSKIFDLFQKYTIKGDIKTSPFFRYVVLFEHNIFSDPGFEEMGRAFRSSPSGPMSDMYRRPFVTLHIDQTSHPQKGYVSSFPPTKNPQSRMNVIYVTSAFHPLILEIEFETFFEKCKMPEKEFGEFLDLGLPMKLCFDIRSSKGPFHVTAKAELYNSVSVKDIFRSGAYTKFDQSKIFSQDFTFDIHQKRPLYGYKGTVKDYPKGGRWGVVLIVVESSMSQGGNISISNPSLVFQIPTEPTDDA